MRIDSEAPIEFVRLPDIPPEQINAHMSDPRIRKHLPLLTSDWQSRVLKDFISKKEAYWHRDGLGHWAILVAGTYAGWGGFQLEGAEWDFGLVLRPECFGHGPRITRKALTFAKADERISFVTFLLPPSRRYRSALRRLGAVFIGEVLYEGVRFQKYRLETAQATTVRK